LQVAAAAVLLHPLIKTRFSSGVPVAATLGQLALDYTSFQHQCQEYFASRLYTERVVSYGGVIPPGNKI